MSHFIVRGGDKGVKKSEHFEGNSRIQHRTFLDAHPNTEWMEWISHRKQRETKQLPSMLPGQLCLAAA